MIDPAPDPEIIREAAASHVPTTPEELWHFCKYVMQLPCEPCGGTGVWSSSAGPQTCLWCHGEGKLGLHFSRVAICPGHVAPLTVLFEAWSGIPKHLLIIGNRGGGKTLMLALIEFLKMWFQRFTVCHMGAVENQAHRAREHYHRIVAELPWSSRLSRQEPGQEAIKFTDGGKIEWLPGTLNQASGPHPELSVLDEVDEAKWDVRQRFLKTPFGPRAQFIEATTHYIQLGTATRIQKESPHLPTRKFCLHGDTLISTPEGEIPIRHLVGKRNIWVYCLVAGQLALRRARGIRRTRRSTSVVQVRYSWQAKRRLEGSIITTPDHLFRLKDGTWKQAGLLLPQDRLTPFYRRRGNDWGLFTGWWIGLGGEEKRPEHRFVFEQVRRSLQAGEVVHHKDHDHWNNQPKNLQARSDSKHKAYHQRIFTQDMTREAARLAKLRESRRCSGSPWNAEVNRRAWANATQEDRARRGRHISIGLKLAGRKGWDTLCSRKSPEELRVFLSARSKLGWERRRQQGELSSNHRVVSVEPAGKSDVFCLDVPGAENFVANGIVVHNCLWETLEKCEYPCDQMPLLDGTVGRCPLYETEEIQTDGSLRTVTLCGGVIARQCDGHIPVPSAATLWADADMYTRRVEFLCEKPGMPMGSRAYWAYVDEVGTGNLLPFNPEPRPDIPLEFTMDFNPGVGMRMCSFIIQQAPPQFGPEWWILDEIVLTTSSTEEVMREFLRRYGPGGHRLLEAGRDLGHPGGLWVFGDATGHARTSVTGETDYDAVVRMLRPIFRDFRLMVPYGTANPPLVDRLNMTNRMLCDLQGGGGTRWVKFAPRCVEGRREMEQMPLGGDRKKDKSIRVQKQLGLSHLGDALECWVATRFPGGPQSAGVRPSLLLGGQRASTEFGIAVGGRRMSAGGGGPNPWLTGKEQDPWK